MVIRRRNKSCVPFIYNEGSYCPPSPCSLQGDLWHRKLRASDRLFNHQTLASARKSVYYEPNPHLIPRDTLDYILASSYLHNEDSFNEPIDPLLQAETLGDDTFRRLRNTIDIHPQQQLQDVFAAKATSGKFLTAGSVDGYVKKPECIPYKYHESKSRPMSKEEAMRLVELVALDDIITSKATNASNNKLKDESWASLTDSFNASVSNFPRTTQQLRLKWENLKKSARKRAANMRRSRLKTGGGKDYFPPDEVLDKVASLLGTTCEGLPVRLGGDALDEVPIVDVPSSSANMQEEIKEEEEGATETLENILEVSPIITKPTPSHQNKFHLHRASGNKQTLKTKQNLERERIQARIKRDLAVAEYMSSKKKFFDAQSEIHDLQLKTLKVELENSNLENQRLKKLLNIQGE